MFWQVHMWEESPVGTWHLEVINHGMSDIHLKDWSLLLLGTQIRPQAAKAAVATP